MRTSEVNYHANRCVCGHQPENEDDHDPNVRRATDLFGRIPKASLTGKDKSLLNTSITNMILSTLRPYELANEPFLHDLILNAMEVGARLGREREFVDSS